MRFKYSTTDSTQNEFDNLPRLPLLLQRDDRRLETVGLVDSGATVNVLPYELGLELGAIWGDRQAMIRLTGNLGNQPAMPFSATAQIGNFPSTVLVFAWVSYPNTLSQVILGQTNFFLSLMFASTALS